MRNIPKDLESRLRKGESIKYSNVKTFGEKGCTTASICYVSRHARFFLYLDGMLAYKCKTFKSFKTKLSIYIKDWYFEEIQVKIK